MMKTLLGIGYVVLFFLFYYAGEKNTKAEFNKVRLYEEMMRYNSLLRRTKKQIMENRHLLDPSTRREMEQSKEFEGI